MAMKYQLNEKNPLFKTLETNPPNWWKELKKDRDIYVEIRKGNYIDIYYRGGAIVKELKYSQGEFKGKMHYKYLPVYSKSSYLPIDFKNEQVLTNKIDIISTIFVKKNLNRVKKQIEYHFTSESEKNIQGRFITSENSCFIDSEFAYGQDRIDLVWLSIPKNGDSKPQIVFVELKTIGDPRIYNGEIEHQLRRYHTFIKQNKTQLTTYYQTLLHIKNKIGVLAPKLKGLPNFTSLEILEKPLLLFGDCNQEWIKEFAPRLDNLIKNVAIGAYYYGEPKFDCDIRGKTIRNRHIYK